MSTEGDRERWEPGDEIRSVPGITGVGTWKSYAPDVCNRCDIEFHDDRGYGTRNSDLERHINAEHPRKCHGHGCSQIAAYAIGGGYTYGSLCAECAHRLAENNPPPFSAWYRLTNEANADAPLLPEDHPAEVALGGLYPDEVKA